MDFRLSVLVAKTIQGVDQVVLQREATKPHGPSEIADMEIQITFGGQSTFLCMPFKTGQEIKSNVVKEDVMYQIFRPFANFDSCIVIFVTAKKCSQPLINYIKRIQGKYGWPIAVIQAEELAKLLKINGFL